MGTSFRLTNGEEVLVVETLTVTARFSARGFTMEGGGGGGGGWY